MKDYLESEMEAVRLAVRNEQKVRAFYLENAEQMHHELAKKTFIFLADEELKHIDMIESFAKAMSLGESPTIDAGSEDEAENRSMEFFSKSVKMVAEKAKASNEELEVYQLGLKMETNGREFYMRSAEEAKHENIQKLFSFLAKEEEAHYSLLDNAMHFLKDPQGFFQDEEGWFFEG